MLGAYTRGPSACPANASPKFPCRWSPEQFAFPRTWPGTLRSVRECCMKLPRDSMNLLADRIQLECDPRCQDTSPPDTIGLDHLLVSRNDAKLALDYESPD